MYQHEITVTLTYESKVNLLLFLFNVIDQSITYNIKRPTWYKYALGQGRVLCTGIKIRSQ